MNTREGNMGEVITNRWFLVNAERIAEPTARQVLNLNVDGMYLTFARVKDGEVVLRFVSQDVHLADDPQMLLGSK